MFHHRLERIQTILCLGAHADDIEIGCGGTVLRLLRENPQLQVHWIVFSGDGQRRDEAMQSARGFLAGAKNPDIQVHAFRDRFFPAQWQEIKLQFDELGKRVRPDVIFTHRREDAHQDHRVVAELTWCTFRDHFVLEYEIPKYEGDLGSPNVYIPLSGDALAAKARMILKEFNTQLEKPWFSSDTFSALARIRGIECRAQFAEAFFSRKVVF